MTKGNFTITYNGEVYNYPDLKEALLKEVPDLKLDSTTDTEILLRTLGHAIEKNGDSENFAEVSPLLNTFNGFFSFALWDAKRRRLLLVRDRYGIKPMYYYRSEAKFVAFASEAEALLSSKLIENPKVNVNTLHLFASISSFFAQTSETLIEGILSLDPGHLLWIDADSGKMKEQVYYELPNEDETLKDMTLQEAVKEMKHLLEDSIQLRMVSDVPLASFLSGGIDSSIITAIASHSAAIASKDASSQNIHSGKHPENSKKHSNDSSEAKETDLSVAQHHGAITAYTVTYIGNGQNAAAASDEEYARKVSAHLGASLVNHKFVEVDPMSFTLDDIDELGDLATWSDDDRLLTVLMNYRAVKREGFSVVLNGQGADEAMGGYVGTGWYRGGMVDIKNPQEPLFDKVLDFVMDPTLFNEPLRSYGPTARQRFHHSWSRFQSIGAEKNVQISMKWLFATSLHRILRFEDYLSMRSAVECRVPILDYRLVDFCFKLPWQTHLKIDEYFGKIVLRECSKAYLPEDVCERPKQVFPNVSADSLNKRLKEIIIENLDQIRECPVIKYVWIPEVFATPEGLDKMSGSDFWMTVIYWRWWTKFEKFGGKFP